MTEATQANTASEATGTAAVSAAPATAAEAQQASAAYHTPSHVVKPLLPFRAETAPGRWEDVDQLVYKENDTTFRSVTRRILFDSNAGQENQVRYFEVQAGGWSTFEHHNHTHQVIIFRGSGTALVGFETRHVKEGDLVFVGPNEWHQFSATDDGPLGFICIVRADRDHPIRPTQAELEEIYAAHPELKGVIRV